MSNGKISVYWNQFWLLCWKNFLLSYRQPLKITLFILTPLTFVFILLLLRLTKGIRVQTTALNYSAFSVGSESLMNNLDRDWMVAFSPDVPFIRNALQMGTVRYQRLFFNKGFADEKSLVTAALASIDSSPDAIFAGIVFDDSYKNMIQFPARITYKIRLPPTPRRQSAPPTLNWMTDQLYPTFPSSVPRSEIQAGSQIPGYYVEGFLYLQSLVNSALIKYLSSNPQASINVRLQHFPFPGYKDDSMVILLQQNLSLFILLCFIVLAPFICKEIVLEKENKIRESMKLMGLSPLINWMAWYFQYFIFTTLSVLLMTFFLHVPTFNEALLNYTNPFITFTFLLLYVNTVIFMCFAIASFFSKANAAAAAGGIIFLVTYLPYFFIQLRYDTMSTSSKIGAMFFNNLAMSFGCNLITKYEGLGIGLQLSTFNSSDLIEDNISMLNVYMMLMIVISICILLTWYMDNLFPGEFGIAKPFYFPFTKLYWCRNSYVCSESDSNNQISFGHPLFNYIEPPEKNKRIGVRISGLTKKFKNIKKPAVDNLSLDIYEGNITALLGHNGAGKTTTMFMLTGFLRPTSGVAFINGYDITKQMGKVRQSLGLCPQHNILFDLLTVEEHLKFFALLKRLPKYSVEEDVTNMIGILHLEDKRKVKSSALSGGMKRKLSVGIALIAGSKFIILDEPTSGMDPEARRQIWDVLQGQRQNRTIVLSTHFMDEADHLGDRIAILADGQLKCYGSSQFLKNKYKIGYHMTVVKDRDCLSDEITKIIFEHVSDARFESEKGAELTYLLPKSQSGLFEALFKFLELNKGRLKIDSYGISFTTLEEVFLKVGQHSDRLLGDTEGSLSNKDTLSLESTGVYEQPDLHEDIDDPAILQDVMSETKIDFKLFTNKYTNPFRKRFQQFKGLFIKSLLHSLRNSIVSFFQLILPAVFCVVGCVVIVTKPNTNDLPPLQLTFPAFKFYHTPYNFTPGSYNSSCFTESLAGISDFEKVKVEQDQDMNAYLLSKARANILDYKRLYIMAAVITDNQFDAYFNDEAYHSVAMAYSYAYNYYLCRYTNSSYTFSTVNHPLPNNPTKIASQQLANNVLIGLLFSYSLSFGMALNVGTYIIFLVKERASGAKLSQLVSGVTVGIYWLAHFVWNCVNFVVPVLFIIVIMLIFNSGGGLAGYASNPNITGILSCLLLYGWAMLPLMYLFSLTFNNASTAYVVVTILNIFTGTAAVLIIWILDLPSINLARVASNLKWLFYAIFPNFCLTIGVQNIYNNYNALQICKPQAYGDSCAFGPNPCCLTNCNTTCLYSNLNYFGWEEPGIARSLTFMVVQGSVAFSLLFVIESSYGNVIKNGLEECFRKTMRHLSFSNLSSRASPQGTVSEIGAEHDTIENVDLQTEMGLLNHRSRDNYVDSDVLEERCKTLNLLNSDLNSDVWSLVVRDLVKYYGDFLAVNKITLSLKQGECFGLLGVNGAGKTSTFKMLTGCESISNGNIHINGIDIASQLRKAQQLMGYCPQFDALIDQLTVEESLFMAGRLHAIIESDLKQVVDHLIEVLMLKKHRYKYTSNLSGGNKRKLSIGLALIGNPSIIFLDEPTTGMDPAARRNLWNFLSAIRDSGKTIILTSHSMDECEALCTRLAIMVNGHFKCLGTAQHLKSKFAKGYSIVLQLKRFKKIDELNSNVRFIMSVISKIFNIDKPTDLHSGLLYYQLDNPVLSWHKLFSILEKIKEKCNIEDYSVGQTSLEQIFINFAKHQRQMD